MICPNCNSIHVRSYEHWQKHTTRAEVWYRRMQCGGCGALYTVEVARIGYGLTDIQANRAQHEGMVVVTGTAEDGKPRLELVPRAGAS